MRISTTGSERKRNLVRFLQNCAPVFVCVDFALEFTQFRILTRVEFELFHHIFAGVMQHVAVGFYIAVIAGEGCIYIDRIGQVVDRVAGRIFTSKLSRQSPIEENSIGYLRGSSIRANASVLITRGRASSRSPTFFA